MLAEIARGDFSAALRIYKKTVPFPGIISRICDQPCLDVYKREEAGDSARKDEDGYIWIIGRIDDVIKVSGYRLGTAEVESGLVSHQAVAEAAAIGLPDELKGNIIYAYCILRQGFEPSANLEEALKQHIREEIGPIVVPAHIEFVKSLPKTRSGKIMRRVLKARAQGLPEGDISTLEE
jgi:acetyl-CoA synthetase